MKHLIFLFSLFVFVFFAGCDFKPSGANMPNIPYEICCDSTGYDDEVCFLCFSREDINNWKKK